LINAYTVKILMKVLFINCYYEHCHLNFSCKLPVEGKNNMQLAAAYFSALIDLFKTIA